MTLSPAQFVAGEAASVNVNLINDGFFDWYGTYYAALFDLEGEYVTTIGELNENQGLPPGFAYLDPFLTFSTNNLDVEPGTYILAMLGEELNQTDINIYPNPASNQINIQGLKQAKTETISIVNSIGQIVFESNNGFSNLNQFDVSSLKSGIYYLRVLSKDKVITKSFIKQ